MSAKYFRTFGNRQSCSLEYTECIADAFSDCGYDVTINGRFIGGEILIRMAGRKLIRRSFRQMFQFHKPHLEFCRFQNVSYHTYQLEHADLFQEFVAPKIRQLLVPI